MQSGLAALPKADTWHSVFAWRTGLFCLLVRCCRLFLLKLLQQTDAWLQLFTAAEPAGVSPKSPFLLSRLWQESCFLSVWLALVKDVENRNSALFLSPFLTPGIYRIVPAVPAANEQVKGLRQSLQL